MRFDTFNGDFEELSRLIESVWGAHFGTKSHFAYPPDWLAGFFGAVGPDRDLLIECRDEAGAITGFLGAVPRRYRVHGQDVRLGLVTLLTSSRRNTGFVGLEIERELFRRAADAGLFGTYHFLLEGQRTADLLRWAAASRKSTATEIAPVRSLLAAARTMAEPADPREIRAATAADLPALADLIETTGRALPLSRLYSAEELGAMLAKAPPKRALVLLRQGRPIGLCVYARRRLLGAESVEVANVDLLVAPDATPEEARRFGKAIAAAAATDGATYVVAPQREAFVFPYAREAGLRLAMRVLRVFVVPSGPEQKVEPGSAHLLEVE